MKAWMRTLSIRLSNGKSALSFGDNVGNNFNIDVIGHKYLSALKDECIIKISNLGYDTVIQIMSGKYYDVEVRAGYREFGDNTIFKGGVLYISNALNSDRTNTIVILCASNLVAKFGQSRMNLTLNSGINAYTAIKYIARKAGIPNEFVSTELKKIKLNNRRTGDYTAAGWLNRLGTENAYLAFNSNGIGNETFSVYDTSKSNKRVINLTSEFINLDGGFPKLTNDGLDFSVMPTFDFACGDMIKLDNSLIDISVTNRNEISGNYGYFLDEEGVYMIFEIGYQLQNRGESFNMDLHCKSRSKISNFINVK